ncbi:hypothetical protein [Polycyclovorans algicola]|uniref:hypothetical protein n=1 Tax=Polycyclovorans algicola TaxID=616992 RepID=UPI0004A7296D|nr:hypothetical protein [Polycyclovorans algicola]
MQMRPDIQIQSMIKALTDVVLPAVDADNKLAHEQTRLVIGLLGLMGKQIPMQFQYDCDELGRLLEFATELQRATGADQPELVAQQQRGSQVLERAKADPAEVVAAVRALRASTGAVISEAFRSADAPVQDRVQKTVLAMTSAQLLRERAWVMAQGWEPDPSAIPAIDTLLPDVKAD